MENKTQSPTSPGAAAKKPKSVAKGYKSPLTEKWDHPSFVDYDSDKYAFLEVENRSFNPTSGVKTSKPHIVSFNRHDLMEFKGKMVKKKIDGKMVETWPIISQKRAQGLSVNAVLHIPEKFGIDIAVDQWPKK